ncbi:similar to Saccharomyces cerevisiae YGL232W TAN1 Putative tRNA acetyltransferase [Maudiozyma saulgeensis]|uniref:Similar to Saccharomyces cerevisiae YGL232W TAN1 Putative tRNA acetyltransferase n=1 Tax=Maudiozyma saulgeensis TaxID=1789683 RepID=A0A1X7QXY8_9SACH|nr:similar to Saccharomyces cerevisiae YGL232W TAN1 Putative tRNA acetyltransferase [Kazachstania saulgeensis]
MSTKRSSDGKGDQKKKKFKVASGFLDPGTSGIYATCTRRKERQAAQELGLLFEEKLQEIYGDKLKELENDDNIDENVNEPKTTEELSIEEQIQQELSEIKTASNPISKEQKKKELLHFVDLDCECVVFCKTRRPIVPEEFVKKIMDELIDPQNSIKRTRYVQKLTPVTNSCSASMEQILKLAEKVLSPHFHSTESEKEGYKFAVEVTRRNFNTIPKMDIINNLVSVVCENGKYKHKVDLKNYDKLILVECFKNNVGISVVNGDYNKSYKRYNVQQIFEAKLNQKDTEAITAKPKKP